MAKIEFNSDERAAIVDRIKLYFSEELNQSIGQFDAGFLLDFFTEEIGPYYYNRGLLDAQAVIEEKVESITDALYEIEQPIRR
jgi:uncharacterized protein (DUF2164 family)